MKKILLVLIGLIVIGCSGSSPIGSYETVQKKFPNGHVYTLIGNEYRFIVVNEDGDIFFVENMKATSDDISSCQKVFGKKEYVSTVQEEK